MKTAEFSPEYSEELKMWLHSEEELEDGSAGVASYGCLKQVFCCSFDMVRAAENMNLHHFCPVLGHLKDPP